MEHGVGVVGLGHGFGQAGDAKEEELDGSQVLIFLDGGVRFTRINDPARVHVLAYGLRSLKRAFSLQRVSCLEEAGFGVI
jgi:hypothetical protein